MKQELHALKQKLEDHANAWEDVTMDIEKEKCQYCGKPAKNFQFAAFICDSDECAQKAMEDRGGPAGHIKEKMKKHQVEEP